MARLKLARPLPEIPAQAGIHSGSPASGRYPSSIPVWTPAFAGVLERLGDRGEPRHHWDGK